MRLLSAQEKQLCLRILHGHGKNNNIQNIIDEDLGGILISTDSLTKKVEIEFPINSPAPSADETNIIINRIDEVSKLMVVAVTLINLLEREGYILIYQRASRLNTTSRFGQGIGNSSNNITYDFSDKKIGELLIDYSSKEILVTPEFERFCAKKFTARDEQRFSRQIKLAYIALGVALFAAFVNLGFNIYNSFISDSNRIKTAQMKSILDECIKIDHKLDSIHLATLQLVQKNEQITEKTAAKRK